MADFYTNEAPAKTRPVVKQDGRNVGTRPVRRILSFTYAAQAAGSRLMLPKIPKGARGIRYRIQSTDALGTATLALGIAGTTGKYRAAATLNVITAEDISSAANTIAVLAADEEAFITTAVAALPAAGTLVVEQLYNV